MKPLIIFMAWLLATLLPAAEAHAADAASSAQPQILLQAWQVQSHVEAGMTQERLQPLNQVRPGDVIEYEAHYVNGNAGAARGVQLTLPVPDGGLRYLPTPGSATPVHSASVDGVHFEAVPLRRAVRTLDGGLLIKDVPVSEYRFLRWSLGDLPAGAKRVVRARMQLPPVSVASRP